VRSPRVVSLVPSTTETLLDWGVVPAGVTRWCEHPELPQVGGTKDPDIAAIVATRPDLVVVDREENRREDAEALIAAGIEVHALWIRSVADVGPQLAALAARLGCGPRWRSPDLPEPAAPRRRVFVPIWRESPREGQAVRLTTLNDDTYGASMLTAAGAANAFGTEPDRYPQTSVGEAAARTPELVLAPSEPYRFTARHVPELSQIAEVRLVDGRDLFWWGTRTSAALRRLVEVLS